MPRVLTAAGLALVVAALVLLAFARRERGFDPLPRLAAISLLEVPYHKEAAAAFAAIVRADGRFAFDRINLALALLGVPDHGAALRALDDAERIAPGHPTAAYARGIALMHLRRLPEARDAFARAGRCAGALAFLGRVKAELGDPGAVADLLEAARAAGEDPGVLPLARARLVFLAHMELSLIAVRRGDAAASRRHHAITQALPLAATPGWSEVEPFPCALPVLPYSADAARELAREGITPPREPAAPPLELEPRTWPAPPPRGWDPDGDGTLDPFPPAVPAGPVLVLDADHDGDLDLLAATATGLQSFRNVGATTGAVVLAPESHARLGLTTAAPPVAGLEAGDLDDGNDIDVVAFAPGHPPLALLSRRQDRFDRRALAGPPATGPGALADLDGDGRLDVAYPAAGGVVVLPLGGEGPPTRIALPGARHLTAADLDLDGRPDLVVLADGVFVLPGGRAPARALGPATAPPRVEDLDGDGDLDLAVPGGGWENRSGARAGAIRLTLRGTGGKSSALGVGSRVDVWRGAHRESRTVRRSPEVFGLGGAARADRVRVVWSNGVIQNETAVAAGTALTMVQRPGLGASCPYIYVHGPRGLEYLTDVLAGAPVGLPSAQGGEVPADPHELIRLPELEGPLVKIRLTEEYREVTYLDRAELVVVDHAPHLTVLPEGGIAARRAGAEPGVLAFDRVEPVTAAFAHGADVTALLARRDGKHREPPRTALQGVAGRDVLELALPPWPADRRAWLVLDGLVYWTDAGLNRRLAQSAPHAAALPRLEVPDGRGGWRTALEPLPFPAGRDKTALAEITGLVDPRDPRVRLVTGMRLYLDRVAVASRPAASWPAGALQVARVPARAARMLEHGFWRLLPDPDRPPWTLAPQPTSPLEVTWLPPRGAYTAFGDVTPLIARPDDRFAIFGPGDGVDVEFAATSPPGAGRQRALFVLLTGFDKDGHPATRTSATVDPLPYRATGERERAALDAEHARWRTRHRR